jgi:integrase
MLMTQSDFSTKLVKEPKKPLTDLAIKQAKPKEKVWRLLDGDKTYRGLRLEVFPDGSKRWAFRFSFEGVDCTEGLGVYPTVSLAAAREACLKSKVLLSQGIKPTEHKKLVKEARRIAKEHTVEAIAAKWFEWRKKKKNLDERNAQKIWASLENHVFPTIGHLPVSEVRTVKCLAILEVMQRKDIGDQAKRILQRLNGIFDYAVTHQLIENSPVVSLKVDEIIVAKVKNRPSLPIEHIQQFLSDLDASKASSASKLALRLQILTGVRTTELRGAMWSEIDLAKALWTIPPERQEVQASGGGMKMRERHVVPLSHQAMSIIQKLKKHSGKNIFLFPSPANPRKCMSDAALSKLMKELGYDGNTNGKPHAVPHGFRTTMKMAAIKSKLFIPRAIEFQLAHKNPNAIEAAYERPEEYLDERIRMVQWYGDHVQAFASNIVKF